MTDTPAPAPKPMIPDEVYRHTSIGYDKKPPPAISDAVSKAIDGWEFWARRLHRRNCTCRPADLKAYAEARQALEAAITASLADREARIKELEAELKRRDEEVLEEHEEWLTMIGARSEEP